MIVDKNHGGRPVLQGQGHDLPGVYGAPRETPQEDVLVHDQLVLAIEEQDLENFPLEIPHGLEEVVEDGFGRSENRRYFLYDRTLLSGLSRCGWDSVKVFFQSMIPEEVVKLILSLAAFGVQRPLRSEDLTRR
ncbi:MAG: hypothetical protein V1758_07735 [Pseudomonadota bacterium]